jgi:hypothetical protein
MRNRYAVLAFSAVCVASVLPGFQRKVQGRAAVAPYTAHFTVTENRILIGGSQWNAVRTEVRARDRDGRIYTKTERVFQNGDQRKEWFQFYVEDPTKLQTVIWESNGKIAAVRHWPYWSGRKGCWANETGEIQARFGDEYKTPKSPAEGKLESIEEVPTPSGDKRIKTRVVTENLGQKEIHGMTAFGTRMTMTPLEDGGPYAMPETTTENWYSKEFNLDLLQITSGPKYGLKRTELVDLKPGDPDPALFELPQGYMVTNTTYHQVECGQK